MLRERYFDRLGFSKDEVETLLMPSKENLDQIMEAHLDRITFDNLSQHGLPHPASLDIEKMARKLLDEKRGGFCFELNGLLGELLLELGYSVKRVPAIVHVPDIGFRHKATHLINIVKCHKDDEQEWVVDVGFGEPAINSLKYELNTAQETPEGMLSRLVECDEDTDGVILEWKKENSTWSPRLKWQIDHPGQELPEFQEGLEAVLGKTSIFHQKLIVCKINRNEKITLAGTRLKRTSPRFGPKNAAIVEHLETTEAVQKTLVDTFNIPNPVGLDLTKSREAQPEVWSQL